MSQATGLSNGETVTVTGSGFSPNKPYGVEMCTDVVTSNNDCDPTTAQTGRTNSSGGFSVSYQVTQSITTNAQGNVTCNSSGNCAVGASNFTNSNALPAGSETVGFAGGAPASSSSGSLCCTGGGGTGTTTTTDNNSGGSSGGSTGSATSASPSASATSAASGISGSSSGGGTNSIAGAAPSTPLATSITTDLPWPLLAAAGFLFLLLSFVAGSLLRLRSLGG